MASPHTRGWTLCWTSLTRTDRGFPAHAGMDRGPLPPGYGSNRLPRTRGDGPSAGNGPWSNEAASPHTRGWTRLDLMDRAAALGFPAHAGMDPCLR